MIYIINETLTDQNHHDFELQGDESFEYGGLLVNSLAAAVAAAEADTGMSLAEIAEESFTGGVDVKVAGRDIWITIVPNNAKCLN